MTATVPASTASAAAQRGVTPATGITCTIDGFPITVPNGTLIIRAAEQIGIEIPRFCDHPLLSPVANCRMCLIEIAGMPKLQPACACALTDGMVVKTQATSEVADAAQRGVMEFLLINHPLDCPVCDKGGECPLQNQSMTHGTGVSRFSGTKRTFPKPIPVSSLILLDRERCVSCARCTRFADEIAGDPFIELFERGGQQQVAIADDTPFDSYFSGNTVQICPVGALTSTDYRFKARPFDLVSVPTTCEHCASGCSLRVDYRHDVVERRLAWDDPDVNEDWNCDKGRFAFQYLDKDRIKTPMIRENGDLRGASWPEALGVVADKLRAARGRAAVLTGGRLTREDAYAYAKFARVALGSDDIDFRARETSDEEAQLIASLIAGSGLGVTYADLEHAPIVLLVGLEPEEESPMIFLRLRKGILACTTKVAAIAPWASSGFAKASGVVLAATPGGEGLVLDALRTRPAGLSDAGGAVADALAEPGAVILIGERLAGAPGAISCAIALAGQTGAALAWVPRRAGERGAADAGALPGLLAGGRPLTDPLARNEIAKVWGINASDLPREPGLTYAGIVDAINSFDDAAGSSDSSSDSADQPQPRVAALIVAGVEVDDVPDATRLRAALEKVDFVVSLETRWSEVAQRADVVLPVAVDTERAGAYVDWEGRVRPFTKVIRERFAMTDARVLAAIAEEMDRSIGTGDDAQLRREIDDLAPWSGQRANVPNLTPPVPPSPAAGQATLATWRHLLDLGVLQQGAPELAGTRRPAVARMSATTAASIGANDNDLVTVATDAGAITLPLVVTDMPDAVVWVPSNSPDSTVNATLGVTTGALVRISQGGTA